MTANPQTPPPTNLVTVTIDGRPLSVPKGTLLVEAARQAGIEIPVFCYHPKLKPVGACRMCLVEIEKMPRLQTACTTPVADGMVVRTATRQVVEAQNGVIELLLANHPLDCPICDRGGECPLQDNAFKYGRGTSRFGEDKRHLDKAFPLSERIVLDKERCIMCLRCVRFQAEIPGDEALKLVNRGATSEVGTLPGETFDSPFSGNTIELCPVGALTSRQYRFKARPWDLQRTPSVCVGCAVGCNVELHARDGRLLRLVSRENSQVDDGWLCDYGRFDTVAELWGERAIRPLVRRGAVLEPATWEEALRRAADVLSSGPAGVLASPRLTREALWVLARALVPTLARGRPGVPAACWPSVPTSWPIEGDLPSLPACRSILLVGLDPWRELPVLALWIRKAVLKGGKLVVIGQENGLYRDTAHWLKVERGGEAEVASALLGCLLGEGEGMAAEIRAAAAALSGRPGAVLAGPHLARTRDRSTLSLLQRLADRLGAEPAAGGVRGTPGFAANARGALAIAPDLAAAEPEAVLATPELAALLLVGDETWPAVGAARLVQLTSRASLLVGHPPAPANGESPRPPQSGLEVVLPLAHPYEQGGTIANLAGRVQRLQPGGFAPRQARPDWEALAALANVLGASIPSDLAQLQRLMQDPMAGRPLEPLRA